MDKWTAEDLSSEESEMIVDFVEWAGEFDRQILDRKPSKVIRTKLGLKKH